MQSNRIWTTSYKTAGRRSARTWLTATDQFSQRLTLVICAQGGHIEHRLAYTDCGKTLWHTSKLILLEYVSTDIYKVPYFD